MAAQPSALAQTLVRWTEGFLTRRKQKQLRRKAKEARKHPVRDWIEAFLWAAMVVLVVNQYFLQAYLIPSPSMRTTLEEGDHLFVDKLSYGPELLPGVLKLPGVSEPRRTDVMCFENPAYSSNGTVFMIAQRLIYMLTLSMVDIDRIGTSGSEYPPEKMYLLIKRVAGDEGDQWRYRDGAFQVKPRGESWMSEEDFKTRSGFDYRTRREVSPADYVAARERAEAWVRAAITGREPATGAVIGEDPHNNELLVSEAVYRLIPRFGQNRGLSQVVNGWYVPDGYILPLGDNRDRSKDGRYFGPVAKDKVLGKAMFIYWPFNRITGLN